MTKTTITTYDNPYDPFKEWDNWYNWDENFGQYHTWGWIDRYVNAVTDRDRERYAGKSDRDIAMTMFMIDHPHTHKWVTQNEDESDE